MENRQFLTKDQLAALERLSAVLAKIPPESVGLVATNAAIFISGMEAAMRVEARPSA